MLQKVTKSLFWGKYQHKVVLVTPIASAFRDVDSASNLIKKMHIAFKLSDDRTHYSYRMNKPKSEEDFDYAYKLQKLLDKTEDFDVRVESPWISIYTNNKKDLDALIKLDTSKVKYVCSPEGDNTIEPGTIIMPKMLFDYKITLARTNQNYDAFISWADANASKVKITKSCRKMLSKDHSWGGSHFYIKGDNTLLMAKMHLGSAVGKVERIVQATT